MKHDPKRRVGEECSKLYQDWIENGMLDKYLSGKIID